MADQHFTDDNFQDAVIAASKDKPVLVDFFAVWCGPCQQQAPIVEELAGKMGKKAVIGKIDVDESPNTAQQFGVMGIPTIKIFRNGEVVEDVSGLHTLEQLEEMMNKHM
jgi:thioredoxin 1